jgi:uncharacterized ferredoxin-like protein
MAKTQKKTTKNSNGVDEINTSVIENNEVSNVTETKENIGSTNNKETVEDVFTYVSLKPSSNDLNKINVIELLALEKACALLCKRYETTAQLDFMNNAKFKEFKSYYEMIFDELEARIVNVCKK